MPVDNPQTDRMRRGALDGLGLLIRPACPEFDEMCERIREQFRAAAGLVKLVDNDTIIVAAQAGIDLADHLPRHEAFSDYTIRSEEVFVVPDAAKDLRFAHNPLVTGERHIRFYAGAPLIYDREFRLGSLCLFDTKPREFSLGDRAELAGMADELIGFLILRESDKAHHRLLEH